MAATLQQGSFPMTNLADYTGTVGPNVFRVPAPRPMDVVLGRGKPFQSHPGNRKMIEFVDIFKFDYVVTGRPGKTTIIESIMKAIQETGGKFLSRVDNEGFWVEVSYSISFRKIGHAFRSRARNPPSFNKDKKMGARALEMQQHQRLQTPPTQQEIETKFHRLRAAGTRTNLMRTPGPKMLEDSSLARMRAQHQLGLMGQNEFLMSQEKSMREQQTATNFYTSGVFPSRSTRHLGRDMMLPASTEMDVLLLERRRAEMTMARDQHQCFFMGQPQAGILSSAGMRMPHPTAGSYDPGVPYHPTEAAMTSTSMLTEDGDEIIMIRRPRRMLPGGGSPGMMAMSINQPQSVSSAAMMANSYTGAPQHDAMGGGVLNEGTHPTGAHRMLHRLPMAGSFGMPFSVADLQRRRTRMLMGAGDTQMVDDYSNTPVSSSPASFGRHSLPVRFGSERLGNVP